MDMFTSIRSNLFHKLFGLNLKMEEMPSVVIDYRGQCKGYGYYNPLIMLIVNTTLNIILNKFSFFYLIFFSLIILTYWSTVANRALEA